jgi:hypothetical protein
LLVYVGWQDRSDQTLVVFIAQNSQVDYLPVTTTAATKEGGGGGVREE